MLNYGFWSTDDISEGRRSSHDFEQDSPPTTSSRTAPN